MKRMMLTVGMALLVVAGFYIAKKLYLRPANITGEEAKEIHGQLPDGSPFALSDLRGKYVLLDFWGSWCGPCRQSHPQLVDLYARYNRQSFRDADGFEIVSVAMERNRFNWENAIQSDGLSWPYHLMETGSFDSTQAKIYDVKQIPTKFLINPEGIIMAVDPSFEELHKLLGARAKSAG